MTRAGLLLVTFGLLSVSTDAGANAAPKEDRDKLRGTWLTVSLVNDGKRLLGEGVAAKPGPTATLVYDGDRWTVMVGARSVATGTFVLRPKEIPKQIDVLDETGKLNDQTKLGIYSLEGDTYTYCLAPAGKPRPTELVSKEGSGNSCGISQRAKPAH